MDLSDLCAEFICDRCDYRSCEHDCHDEQMWDDLDGWTETGDEYDPADDEPERNVVTVQPVGGVL